MTTQEHVTPRVEMPSPRVSLAAGPAPHRNRALFSDHYLADRLPARPDWRALEPEAARALTAIRAIHAAFHPSDNEAQTEQDWIKPVLAALGHVFEVQPSLAVPGRAAQRPDYVFYRDEAARAGMKGVLLREDEIAGGLAVGDAKYWDRPLDQAISGGGDPFTNKNPGYQIAFYLQYTGLPWGILTNGRLWRLYHRGRRRIGWTITTRWTWWRCCGAPRRRGCRWGRGEAERDAPSLIMLC